MTEVWKGLWALWAIKLFFNFMRLWYICIHHVTIIITWYFNFEAYFRWWRWACWWCCWCYATLWLHLVGIMIVIDGLLFSCTLDYLIEIGLKAEFGLNAQCWLLIGWQSFDLTWRNGILRLLRMRLIWAFVNFLNMYKRHMSIFIIFSAKSFVTNLTFEWSFLWVNNFVVFQMRKTTLKRSK